MHARQMGLPMHVLESPKFDQFVVDKPRSIGFKHAESKNFHISRYQNISTGPV